MGGSPSYTTGLFQEELEIPSVGTYAIGIAPRFATMTHSHNSPDPTAGRCLVYSPQAPAPIGPYSQGIAVQGPFIFTSGQIALDVGTMTLVGEDVKVQTAQAIRNLAAVLESGGTSLQNVVKTTVFLADINDFAAMNEVYGQFFAQDPPPARSCVQVARLPKDALVEIEAIAWHP